MSTPTAGSFKYHIHIPLHLDVTVEKQTWLEKLVGLHESPFLGVWKEGFPGA